jgi:hypothetical protein
MNVQISGTRNGEDWPAPGEEITVADWEADDLIRNGQASSTDATDEENALADALGVEVSTIQGNKSVRALLKPAPHADEPQAYHVPVLGGEEAAAADGQKHVDEANRDLVGDAVVDENKDLHETGAPADDAPARKPAARKSGLTKGDLAK